MHTAFRLFFNALAHTTHNVFNACKDSRFLLWLPLLCLFFLTSCSDKTPPRILIFSKTAGYRHACIPTATAALRQMCYQNGIAVDTTEEAEDFTENNLKRYNAVVFLCTTGDVLSPTQEADFERYIQAGGGFVGIHSTTDTEYGWGWFGGLVGAYFNGHPAQQNATLHVENHEHPATKHLKGDDWARFDEWYNFKNLNPNTKVLLTIDEASYKGGTNGNPHPMSWYHEYDGGRSFYTALGHTNESYAEPDFMKHVLGGIRYAIGKQKRLDYTACKTPEQPDPTRFVKTVLVNELTEPMELDMLPDGKIIFIERRGNIKLFNPATGIVSIAYRLPVYSEQEDGLMGLALDPNYAENNWIYLYYSSVGDQSFNTLSRFIFRGDSLDRASEKIILQVAVQRQECCHTGGCIEFDAEGNLFLSTGDNTNPFDSKGYSPSDERPGRSPWDAQKSSANTNDLRGKILRIKPLPDGSYICPAGNLFNQNAITLQWGSPESKQMTTNSQQQSGRPEIYVMGCRNPYRISIDDRRKLLFWGEVGPDAGEPDSTRGPAGHDEVNRARAA
ncbi:MAG: ThuA domain-containing protein, partial [Saprospiraceae bacterium]|nr:ThuA domain-containing protein [Saprospiraceae bacterium]